MTKGLPFIQERKKKGPFSYHKVIKKIKKVNFEILYFLIRTLFFFTCLLKRSFTSINLTSELPKQSHA